MNDNEEFIQEFLVESAENLDQLEQDLVALETNPRDPERLASIFRAIHTIKGTSGFFGFAKLGALTHAGESLLSRLRDGDFTLDAELANILLDMVDATRQILGVIEQGGTEGGEDYSALAARLLDLAARPADQPAATASADELESLGAASESPPAEPPESEAKTKPQRTKDAAAVKSKSTDKPKAVPKPKPRAKTEPKAKPKSKSRKPRATAATKRGRQAAMPASTMAADAGPEPAADVTKLVESAPVTTPVEARTSPELDVPASASAGSAGDSPTAKTIRVDVGLLGQLVDMAGELVLARNQIMPFRDALADRVFVRATQQLDLITSDLQAAIMRTRMQPIGNLWSKFPRIVRDLARRTGKQVTLTMEGQETELDRTLLEAVTDPLTHLIRNAVDHGIETPDQRTRQGKPPTGRVRLRAFHEGGLVNVEIADDGAGIEPARIRDKAARQGLITPEQLGAMSDSQVIQLIFLPGFSTAREVTDISGRGVGMDVVKTNIDRIGGAVELSSRPGHGTTVRVKIPLTLSIIPALVVVCRRQPFAIPQASLREVVTAGTDTSRRGIEYVGNALVYRLRGELIPVLRLDELVGHVAADAFHAPESDAMEIVILQAAGRRFGLIVDAVRNSEEIVVKPIHPAIRRLEIFSGATIRGDGGVMLILDVARLAKQLHLEQRAQRDTLPRPAATPVTAIDDQSEWLVCRTMRHRQVAIPVRDITRLEEFATASLDIQSGRAAVPYRGGILPLFGLDTRSDITVEMPPAETVAVIVHGEQRQQCGFVVGRILDVVQLPRTAIETGGDAAPDTRRQVLIDGQITDLIDLGQHAALCPVTRTNAHTEVGS